MPDLPQQCQNALEVERSHKPNGNGAVSGLKAVQYENVFIHPKDEFLPTLVKRGATFGANCTIICGVTIGLYAFIGAGAVVIKDVPDFALMVGNPTKLIGWMCQCGNRIAFAEEDGPGVCRTCHQTYQKTGPRVALR